MLHAKLFLSLALLPLATAAVEPMSVQLHFFEQRIRPVLVEKCYICHSAEAEKLKGGLLLDTRDGVRKGGENGEVITPGEPEKARSSRPSAGTTRTPRWRPKSNCPRRSRTILKSG